MPFQPGNKLAAGRRTPAKEYRELLEKQVPAAIKTLVDVMENSKVDKCRIAAACALLDRCHGRPRQQVSINQNKPVDSDAIVQALADTARGVIVNTNDAGEQQVIITPAKTLPDHNIVDVTPKDNN